MSLIGDSVAEVSAKWRAFQNKRRMEKLACTPEETDTSHTGGIMSDRDVGDGVNTENAARTTDSEQEEEEVLLEAEEVPEEDEDEWTPGFEWKRKRAALRETPENKQKMAAYRKARRATPEYKQKKAAYHATAEYKQKMAAYNKARRATPEYKQKEKARRAKYKQKMAAWEKDRRANSRIQTKDGGLGEGSL